MKTTSRIKNEQTRTQHILSRGFTVALVCAAVNFLLPVNSKAQTDYFLGNGQDPRISTSGGQMPFGEGGSFTLNSWNVPKEVGPGQAVTNQISYTMAGNFNANAVTYKTVLAEWQLDSPIAVLENGILQGSPDTHVLNFSFTAPTSPGIYRLRLAMTWAFKGIKHFYGDGPKGDANNPGVGPWAEVKIRVVAPPSN
jgi:hypothetical protein